MALATGGIIHEVSCFGKPRGSSRSSVTWPPTCNLQPGYRVDMECMPISSRMYCSRLRGTKDKDRKRSAVLRFSIPRFLKQVNRTGFVEGAKLGVMQASTNLISLSLHQSIKTPFIELEQYLLTNRVIGKYVSNPQKRRSSVP